LDQKYKYYKGDILNYDKFTKEIKNLNYLKIDFIYFFENRFIEISIIYQFDIIDFDKDNPKDIKKQIKLFQDDIKELKEDKKYFKILKRYFSINRLLKNNKKLLELNKILNSSSGALYQKKSNLEALKTVSENYKDELTQRKILVNLKELKIPANIKLIEKYIDDLQNTINKEVKKYIE
jgi:signal peptidase I